MRVPAAVRRIGTAALALGVGLTVTACGAGAKPAGAGGTSSSAPGASGAAAGARRTLNPAQIAATDIIRLQPVVPFSPSQIQELVPLLTALAANPGQTAAQLAADGAQIEALFTATQQEALKNMGSQTGPFGASPGASGGAAGFRGLPRTGSGAGGAGARARFLRSGSGSGTGPGGGFAARGGIYQIAIDTLQGKTPTFPGAGAGGAPAGGGPTTAGA